MLLESCQLKYLHFMGNNTQALAASFIAKHPEFAALISEMFPDSETRCCLCSRLTLDDPDLVSHISDIHPQETATVLAAMHYRVHDLKLFLETFGRLFSVK
jgi:hypothetical protein